MMIKCGIRGLEKKQDGMCYIWKVSNKFLIGLCCFCLSYARVLVRETVSVATDPL